MTSDAKIGLLLSLIFIFIIAFVINGLPNFLRGQSSNELTQDYLNKLQSYDADIANGAREIVASIRTLEPVKKSEIIEPRREVAGRVRSVRPLPQVSVPSPPGNIARVETAALPSTVAVLSIEAKPVRPAKPAGPKMHVVQENDSLEFIAKKYYGPAEGVKKENLERIFMANKDTLSSPDMIQVGQRILVPPLRTQPQKPVQARSDLKDQLFNKMESIKARTISLASAIPTGRYQEYVVKDGDSLWKIADEQLSDPGRYLEIAKLNKDVLEDEDQLSVGMHIKLPSK
jgi:nucleoid-associated protein YgaU